MYGTRYSRRFPLATFAPPADFPPAPPPPREALQAARPPPRRLLVFSVSVPSVVGREARVFAFRQPAPADYPSRVFYIPLRSSRNGTHEKLHASRTRIILLRTIRSSDSSVVWGISRIDGARWWLLRARVDLLLHWNSARRIFHTTDALLWDLLRVCCVHLHPCSGGSSVYFGERGQACQRPQRAGTRSHRKARQTKKYFFFRLVSFLLDI